jgi:hypothetical protein
MDLQFGLAIVDQMSGDQAARQCMEGWMHQESKLARRLRTIGAQALITLAARLDATATRAQRQDTALSPANPA